MNEELAASPIRDFFQEQLEKGFNEQAGGMGASILTDWVVVAEVHAGSGPVLRLVDSGLPLWRAVGLLKFALMDAEQDMLILNSHEDDEDA